MRKWFYGKALVWVSFFFLLYAPTTTRGETEGVPPIFGPDKQQKIIKKINKFKKNCMTRLHKYKRCLFTGPCTRKEMNEFRQDMRRLAGGIGVGVLVLYVLKKRAAFIAPVEWLQKRTSQAPELPQEAIVLPKKEGQPKDVENKMPREEIKKEEGEIAQPAIPVVAEPGPPSPKIEVPLSSISDTGEVPEKPVQESPSQEGVSERILKWFFGSEEGGML